MGGVAAEPRRHQGRLGLLGSVETDVSSYILEAEMSDGIWEVRERKAGSEGTSPLLSPPGCGSDELTSRDE